MVRIVRSQARPPAGAARLAPQEQALLHLLRVRDDLVAAIDALRPKILFRHTMEEYREMLRRLRGEVRLEDLLRGLGARGRVRVTY